MPVVGVVHAPLLDRTFCAARASARFATSGRLHVSERAPEQAIVATGFPFRHKELLPAYERVLAAALRGFEDLRRAGAASLDLCWTAEGVFDGFFELRLGPWDVAAGGVIVREAGGVVTDWDGDDRAWLRSGDVLAGPPAVHAALLDIVASVGDHPGPEPPARFAEIKKSFDEPFGSWSDSSPNVGRTKRHISDEHRHVRNPGQ